MRPEFLPGIGLRMRLGMFGGNAQHDTADERHAGGKTCSQTNEQNNGQTKRRARQPGADIQNAGVAQGQIAYHQGEKSNAQILIIIRVAVQQATGSLAPTS